MCCKDAGFVSFSVRGEFVIVCVHMRHLNVQNSRWEKTAKRNTKNHNFPSTGYSQEDKKPKVVYISPEQITSIGEAVKLDCTIDDWGRYAVFWKKQDRERPSYQVVVSVNENLLVREGRFDLKIRNNSAEKTVTLSLLVSTLANEGSFAENGISPMKTNRTYAYLIFKNFVFYKAPFK